MAANKGRSPVARQIQVWFTPSASTPLSSADVCVVDHDGARRLVHLVGSIRLRVGRSHLVGLTPSEVTWLYVDALHTWMSEQRSSLRATAQANASRVAAPAPPEGVTGAVWNALENVPLPGFE